MDGHHGQLQNHVYKAEAHAVLRDTALRGLIAKGRGNYGSTDAELQHLHHHDTGQRGGAGLRAKAIAEKILEVCPELTIDKVVSQTNSNYRVYFKIDNGKDYGTGWSFGNEGTDDLRISAEYKNQAGTWSSLKSTNYIYTAASQFCSNFVGTCVYTLNVSRIGSSYCHIDLKNSIVSSTASFRVVRVTDVAGELIEAATTSALTMRATSIAATPQASSAYGWWCRYNPDIDSMEVINNPDLCTPAGALGSGKYRLYPLLQNLYSAQRAYHNIRFDGAQLYALQMGNADVSVPSGTYYKVDGATYQAIDARCIVPLLRA